MFVTLFSLFFFLPCVIKSNQSAEILLLSPLGIKNYYYILKPLVKSLLDRQHNITAVTATSFPYHHNLKQILIKDSIDYGWNIERKLSFTGNMKFKGTLQSLKPTTPLFTSFGGKTFPSSVEDYRNKDDPRNILLQAYDGYMVSENMFKDQEFRSLLLSDKTFDLVISTDLSLCYSLAAVEHRFKAHGITVLNHDIAAQVSWILGEHYNPAYQSEIYDGLNEQMSFKERLYNVYVIGMTLFVTYSWILPLHESLLESFTEDLPFLQERPYLTNIISNKSLILIPTHHTVQSICSHSPRTRHIAGINIEKNKPLPKVFDNFMSNSPGVILVTSDLSSLNVHKARKLENILISVFDRLMQNVIWKHNLTSSRSVPPNVIIVDWVPQQDILVHRNLKLFITHGGLNSITEATYYGIPLIVTPFYLEHYKNIKKVVNSGAGIVIDSTNFTVESILAGINEINNNPKYRESAMRRSTMFKDKLLSPLEEAVYWIEYIFKHGNILKPATSSMPQYQVFLLDIMALIILFIIVVFYLGRIVLKYIYNKTVKLFYNIQEVNQKVK